MGENEILEEGLMPEETEVATQQEAGSKDELNLEDLLPAEAAQEKGKTPETVPYKALKEERSKRQMYEKRFNDLMAMHQEVLQELRMLRQPRQEATAENGFEIEDDSVITGAELKKILQMERERLLGETKRQTSTQALLTAKKQYEDFDEVVKYADDLIAKYPELKGIEEFILTKPDAPFIAYALGQLHPDYQRKRAQKNSLAERIQNNMEAPQPARKSAVEPSDLYERIKNLDPLSEEFAKLDKKIQDYMRRKYGG